MAEILAVTWGEEELALRRIPSEGVWNKDAKPLKRVPLQRPTRAARLANSEIGGALSIALGDLFADIDINVPCWLLLPNSWTLRFLSEPPDFKSQELTLNHLRWEAKQRISSDPADYKISAALMLGGARYFVCITRTEVIQHCIKSAETADLELSGIGLEPNTNENYTFEHPLDLRDALPLEPENSQSPVKAISKKISPATVGIFLGVVVIIGGYLIFSSGPKSTKPSAQRASKPAMTAREAVMPPLQTPVAKPSDSVKVEPKPTLEAPPVVSENAPAEAPAVPAGDKSLIRGIFGGLPANARIQLVVLSPVDLKIEASEVTSDEQFLAAVKKQPGWGTAKLIGSYVSAIGRVTAIRLENPGWKAQDSKSKSGWEAMAKAAGLTIKGSSATGKLEQALAFFDKIWTDSAGISKVYLSPAGDFWQVVVQ